MKITKKIRKRVVLTLLFCLGFTIIWYVQSRLLASYSCIEIVKIKIEKESPPEKDFIRIACYNIAHARGGVDDASNWTGNTTEQITSHLQNIAAQITRNDIDILILNEIDFKSKWSRNLNQAQTIAQFAKMPYCLQQRNIDFSLPFLTIRFGNAILSRYPISDAGIIRFPAQSKIERIFAGNHDAALAQIDTPKGPIAILAIHLESRSEDTRFNCVETLIQTAADQNTPYIQAVSQLCKILPVQICSPLITNNFL
ncbi:MAG: hypothetical protein GY869_00845 [Planctomycetes bacterium]|nr:hypothetical protein [Planctomycetota bacterium]